jgi:hypothetical protein
MAYQGDDRYGADRWRDRDRGGRYGERGYQRGGQGDWGRGDYGRSDYRSDYERGGYRQDYGRYERGYGADDDRGFFERAGDEVRSWFGDEEAQRRREEDYRRWEREQRMTGGRSNQDTYGAYGERPGGGWGNQRADSWHRDRPGERGWYGERERNEGYNRESYGGRSRWRDADLNSGGPSSGDIYGYDRAPGGTSGFGGSPDAGRRFDRIDPGSVGTHGAHPMSSPVGGSYFPSFGTEPTGFGSQRYSSARDERLVRGDHDPHYSQWRQRQIEELDRDYDEYRRENQSRFENEFGSWRTKRQGQRDSLNRVVEHMEVVGSDGAHVGTVDKVRGDRIILTKSDQAAGGIHHSVPCSWVETVADKVTLNKTAQEAMDSWRSEERSRALFEREDSGSEGPGILNRSFAGTYSDDRGDRIERGDRSDES